ncbi:MAG TPA: Xaa-Pro dipeptidyl-peptidase [Longimicrobiales bacterium]|nr:Xaa-Pro dipeptidyl-peptidase [Longimicrobiales bacterium]
MRRLLRAAFLYALVPALHLGAQPLRAQAEPGPVFENGMAQVVPAFADSARWIREELWVETEFDSDGDGKPDRVRVAVVRPGPTAAGLKVPVVYESSPYYSGTSGVGDFFWDPRQELGRRPNPRNPHPPAPHRPRQGISASHVGDWVPRGFAVVHSEAPGTGLSQGCPTVGGDPEALAPKAVIDWLNGRAKGYDAPAGGREVTAEWSTGKVGMTGTSYNGTIPFAAATTGVEGLEAIIPVAPNTSYYRYYRSNGLVRSPGGYVGEDMDVLYDFIHSQDLERRAWCDQNVRDRELTARQDRVTGDWNDFWEDRDFMVRTQNVRAATLMAHAFNDWNVMPEHSVRVYEALKANGVPAMAYYHQGGHGGPPPMELMNLWFTRYLYGVENGIEEAPRAWIVREGDERGNPTPYADYPNPDAAPATLHLRAGGVQRGGLALEPAPGQGTETLEDNFSFSGQTLALAEWSDHRLLYVTPELQEDVHLSGWSSVTLRVASDREAANLSVWLVELPWTEGRDATGGVITRGWADLRNHRALSREAPADLAAALHRVTDHRAFTGQESLRPGRFYDVTFELNPDDQVIPAGARIGLLVFSSDREFTLRPDPGTHLTLDLDGTSVEIPVVGGAAALERALGGR